MPPRPEIMQSLLLFMPSFCLVPLRLLSLRERSAVLSRNRYSGLGFTRLLFITSDILLLILTNFWHLGCWYVHFRPLDVIFCYVLFLLALIVLRWQCTVFAAFFFRAELSGV